MKYLFLVIGIFSASLSHATWKYGMSINNIQGLSSGGFIIYGPSGSGPTCGEGGKLFYVRENHNSQTVDGVKTALSIALLAFAAGKEITLLYDETSAGCDVNIILVNK